MRGRHGLQGNGGGVRGLEGVAGRSEKIGGMDGKNRGLGVEIRGEVCILLFFGDS